VTGGGVVGGVPESGLMVSRFALSDGEAQRIDVESPIESADGSRNTPDACESTLTVRTLPESKSTTMR